MSMSDNQQQMKPQDTVIYLLGKLEGQVASVHETLNASTATQAAVNAENKREHDKFRETLDAHATDITAIKTAQPVKVSVWVKIGVVIAIPASVIALVGFITVYLQPK